METQRKITAATFKSFVRKNAENLFINVQSSFDGMTDCVERRDGGFRKAVADGRHVEQTLGFPGIWLVGCSRDRFRAFENDNFKGFEVYNACGNYVVATAK